MRKNHLKNKNEKGTDLVFRRICISQAQKCGVQLQIASGVYVDQACPESCGYSITRSCRRRQKQTNGQTDQSWREKMKGLV